MKLLFLLAFCFDDNLILVAIDDEMQWYGYLVTGPINVLLNLNRFTAVVFFKSFKQIWGTRRTVFYIVVVLLVPFAIDGITSLYLKCSYAQLVASIIASRFNTAFNGNTTALKVERKLLLQCSVSTLFFTFIIVGLYFYSAIATTQSDLDDDERFILDIWSSIYNLSWELLYAGDALTLLFISKSIRRTFLNFLSFDKLANCWHNIRPKNKKVQQVLPNGVTLF
uniref:Serpentine receptor class gamma n=1 Tax=Panagrellus redivivus TaxID=6233 RepID=A0A7E4ZVC3_PANRE